MSVFVYFYIKIKTWMNIDVLRYRTFLKHLICEHISHKYVAQNGRNMFESITDLNDNFVLLQNRKS